MNEDLRFLSCLNFTLILPSGLKVECGYSLCPWVSFLNCIYLLQRILQSLRYFSCHSGIHRKDCTKDTVSLLLAAEQAFSSGISVETGNWWACAGVDFLGYMMKNAAWCENSAVKFIKHLLKSPRVFGSH